MFAKIVLALLIVMSSGSVLAQAPPIEPGVSQELARWRAARYSDVRYRLNLTLEKMSPVLKGTMEIRVTVSVPPASAGGRDVASKSVPPASAGGAFPPTDHSQLAENKRE